MYRDHLVTYTLDREMATHWSTDFLTNKSPGRNVALIILNQPFTVPLLNRAWAGSDWHCCADGGANRLHDALSDDLRDKCV
jgi:thiamine pyrophosphokinase